MIKALFKVMAFFAIFVFGWMIYLRVFQSEEYAKWEAEEDRKIAEYQAERDAKKVAENAERLAKKEAEKEKLESPDWLLGYATGEKEGAFLGHSDAIKGVERPTFTLDKDAFNVGDIADHLARHIDNKIAKEAYVRGFTHGYFQAHSNTKAKMKAQGLIN